MKIYIIIHMYLHIWLSIYIFLPNQSDCSVHPHVSIYRFLPLFLPNLTEIQFSNALDVGKVLWNGRYFYLSDYLSIFTKLISRTNSTIYLLISILISILILYDYLPIFTYRPFHKTLPRSSSYVNWSSVRFYETDCI